MPRMARLASNESGARPEDEQLPITCGVFNFDKPCTRFREVSWTSMIGNSQGETEIPLETFRGGRNNPFVFRGKEAVPSTASATS